VQICCGGFLDARIVLGNYTEKLFVPMKGVE
jgi:hypothetical protein